MIIVFFIAATTLALVIEEDVFVNQNLMVAQFSGQNISVEFSAREVDGEKKDLKIQFLVTGEKNNYECDHEKAIIELSDTWSDELTMSLQDSSPFYFYIILCDSPEASLAIRLKIKDSTNEHYSSEYSNYFYMLSLAVALQVVIMISSIIGIFRESHEEVPLALIFVISLLYTISLMFHFLYIWIYGVDGSTYRFVLIFSKFFEIFARISLIGILLLISANRFNPSDFSIEESEFIAFLAVIGIEFLVEVLAIVRYETLLHYSMWTGVEGFIEVAIRVGLVYMASQSNFRKIGARLEGFGKIDAVVKGFVMLPVLTMITSVLVSGYMKATILFAFEQFGPIFGLGFLVLKFLSNNFVGLLPLKTHNF